MKFGSLKDVTGKFAKESVEWLTENKMGCCSICFATDNRYNYAVCIGWHDIGDEWVLAWKIGRQTLNNVMQCDLDVDFEMPYDPETGDVDDTLHVLDPLPKTKRDWEREATLARKEARRIWREWAEEDDEE